MQCAVCTVYLVPYTVLCTLYFTVNSHYLTDVFDIPYSMPDTLYEKYEKYGRCGFLSSFFSSTKIYVVLFKFLPLLHFYFICLLLPRKPELWHEISLKIDFELTSFVKSYSDVKLRVGKEVYKEFCLLREGLLQKCCILYQKPHGHICVHCAARYMNKQFRCSLPCAMWIFWNIECSVLL